MRLVDAVEIVPDDIERHHAHVVLEFLGERIGELCEPMEVYPHGENLPLDV